VRQQGNGSAKEADGQKNKNRGPASHGIPPKFARK
jgi:hypothetical protein